MAPLQIPFAASIRRQRRWVFPALEIPSRLINSEIENSYKQFENLRKQIERQSDGTRSKHWGDYAYNRHSISRKWHYRSVSYTNNYKQLDSTFNVAKNYIQKRTKKIIASQFSISR